MSDNSFNQAAAAVPEQEQATAPESANPEVSQEAEHQELRTFTQEELDKIVSEAKAKAERKVRRELERAAEEAAQRPAPTNRPDPKDFKGDFEAYNEALSDWKAEQKIAEREQKQQVNKVIEQFEARQEEARDKYGDYDQVVHRLPKDGGPTITPLMAEAIRGSELGPDIAYHLGQNTKESRRIASLPEIDQIREIGKIEASLSANPPAKKVSSAPEPIKPLGSRSSVPNYSTSDPRSVKTTDPSEWINKRNKELAGQ